MSSNHSMVTNLDQVPSYWLEPETIKLAGSRDETNFRIPSTREIQLLSASTQKHINLFCVKGLNSQKYWSLFNCVYLHPYAYRASKT